MPAEVTVTPADLKLVHLVRLRVTGAKEKPVANAVIVLADAAGKNHQASDAGPPGEIDFEDVAKGPAKLTVAPLSASPTEKTVNIGLQKGEAAQNLTVGLPEVTAVVESPSPAAGARRDGECSRRGLRAPGWRSGAAVRHVAAAAHRASERAQRRSTFFQTILGVPHPRRDMGSGFTLTARSRAGQSRARWPNWGCSSPRSPAARRGSGSGAGVLAAPAGGGRP